jgi:hypothetical protein
MSTYTVRQTFQYPAWNEVNGIPYTVEASSKSEAIRKARREAERCGHDGTQKGRRTFKVIAEVAE